MKEDDADQHALEAAIVAICAALKEQGTLSTAIAHLEFLKTESARGKPSTAERKLRLCLMRRYESAPDEDRLR
jgi:hypothetical protein